MFLGGTYVALLRSETQQQRNNASHIIQALNQAAKTLLIKRSKILYDFLSSIYT